MTNPQDPPRLIDTDEGSEKLRELVRECKSDVGTPEEVQKLESRLVPLLWVPTPTAPGPGTGASSGAAGTAATTATSSVIVKTGAAIAVAATLAGGGMWLAKSSSHDASDRTAAPAIVATDTTAPKVEPPAAAAPEAPPAAAPTEVDQQVAPRTVAPNERPTPNKERSEPTSESVSESDLLGRAQAALRGDPARTLALAAEHRRRFPGGVLAQEREVLSIEALERLGRHKEAVQRADGFLRSFPGSAHRSKVNAVIGRE